LSDQIRIRGARQHNLKGCDVDFPRGRLTAVSGVSGSGKSSLVFDTLYAEGQRCYVESLSTYARQFLERMPKPEVDWIDGISPAIAIGQRNAARSGRSTVGTVTEINDYLRVLFARVGVLVCPTCGEKVERETPASIWRKARQRWAEETPLLVAWPLVVTATAAREGWAAPLLAQGWQRALVGGVLLRLEAADVAGAPRPTAGEAVEVVVDRLTLAPADRSRFAEAVTLAMRLGEGRVVLRDAALTERRVWSAQLACAGCERAFPESTPHLFSFNSPQGACPACRGFGNRLEFDEAKIVPEPALTIMDGAIKPWRTPSFARQFSVLVRWCRRRRIPTDLPWRQLSPSQQRLVLEATDGEYVGVIPFLEEMRRKIEQEHHRFYTRRYLGDTACRACGGSRLRPEALAVRINGLDIGQLGRLPVVTALARVEGLRLSKGALAAAGEVREEVLHRLRFLERVGLGYLTLDRLTRTLSGGEAQRIHLANALGSRLVDTLYVLDEPTSGLHAADVERLIATLRDLVAGGNTVVVVEHDLDVLRAADHFVELGPGAGRLGGEVVFQGALTDLLADGNTLTAAWLRGEKRLERPRARRGDPPRQIQVRGARRHNLRDLDVRIPLGRFVCLTGVSGSGKSSLLNGCLYDGLTGRATGGAGRDQAFTALQGAEAVDKVVRVDQAPIGRTSRSNPATFLQVLGPIRELFAATPEARVRAWPAGRFSFNTAGGRCPACQGLGEHRVEMHFMADISVPCEECGGSRFNPATLEVRYRGLNIAQVLGMTVEESLAFFAGQAGVTDRLWILRKVGLGYLQLGQSAPTLSGGESQRLKIARELAVPSGRRNLYLLDEPTTGLHVDDIAALARVLHELVDQGHGVVVIEHNLELVEQADWIIDLGPGGGEAGGKLVAEGTPAEVAACPASVTGRFLARRRNGAGRRKEARP
jgi:excinuclease ABC subunit A